MQYAGKISILTALLLMLVAPIASAQEPANVVEQNKTIAIQSIEMLWNADHPEQIADYFAEPFRIHTPIYHQSTVLSNSTSDSYYAAVLEDYHRAFPDLVMTVEHVAAESDMVFLHISAEGSFDGEFVTPLGRTVSPSGDKLSWEDVWVYRFEDGKIAEWWGYSQLPLFGFDQNLSRFD